MNHRSAFVLRVVLLLVMSACAPAAQNLPLSPDNTEESQKVEPTPANNLAVLWQRSGGIAGICQRLTISQEGMYEILDCRQSRTLGTGHLAPERQSTLDDYINRFQTFQWENDLPEGSADMFMDEYTFYGQGDQIPSEQQKQEINIYLAKLSQELSTSNTLTPQPEKSGISGQVLIGPTCAGPAPADGECPDKPLQTKIEILDQNGHLVAEIQTDPDGRFEIPLAPGAYELRIQDKATVRIPTVQSISLEAGKISQVDIRVDSGIR